MTEIDEYARRAIDSPVVPPPEMATLVTLAGRHRRNRRGVRATLAVGLVGSVVAAIAVFSSFPPNHSSLRVTATSPKTATSTTKIGSSESHVLTIAGLTDRLTRAGLHVAVDGTAPGFPFATVEHLLCVNGTQVSVYEYTDTSARASVSAGISADGSRFDFPTPGSTTRAVIMEWIGPPHFFADGRIIVLVLQDDDRVLRALTGILGPTVSPQALRLYDHKSPCTTKKP